MEELANTVADKSGDRMYTLNNLLQKATEVEKLVPEAKQEQTAQKTKEQEGLAKEQKKQPESQKNERFEEIKKNLDEQQKMIDRQKKIIEQRQSRDATLSV